VHGQRVRGLAFRTPGVACWAGRRPGRHASARLRGAERDRLAGRKPYLLLMNTDFEAFGPELVERYFQRSLFYGMYPSMFSRNAAENPYWRNPAWYGRDRPLFRRYIPLIRRIAEAGWQPVTEAVCEPAAILVERFGPVADGTVYYTLLNDGGTPVEGWLRPVAGAFPDPARVIATEFLSGERLAWSGQGWRVVMGAGASAVVGVERAP